ncbi:MAG: hypothetical protein IJG63_05635 [Oscillospiraceae bacterium]|nr:hypothetical protein [Oscillospiraceae bacterium]
MSAPLHLKILSSTGRLLDERADYVGLRARDGSLGILKGHAPAIVSLVKGEVEYKRGEESFSLEISGGIAEVMDDNVIIIVDDEPK